MQVFICTNVGGAVVAAATVSVTVSSLFTIFGASFAGVGVGVNGLLSRLVTGLIVVFVEVIFSPLFIVSEGGRIKRTTHLYHSRPGLVAPPVLAQGM